MKVAILSSTPASPLEGSGTFVALNGLIRGLGRLGHNVSFRPLQFRTRFHTLDRWLYNASVAARPPGADVVVGVDLDGFLWAARAARRRTPYVVTLKGVIADELRHERGWVRRLLTIQSRWERLNTRRADRVVVGSRYSADVAHDLYGVPIAKIVVIPEPIDLESWRHHLGEAVPRVSDRPTVLAVARMYRRKRIEDLLEAAHRVRERISGVQFRIVGDGPEFARLTARAATLGLGTTVAFLGQVSGRALAVEYVSADLFCLPSVQEGFGIVFAEAMAAGLPVVACRAAAVPEVVEHGRTGILVAPAHPEALSEAIETLLRNADIRQQMGANGMKRVGAFDVERVVEQWLPVLSR